MSSELRETVMTVLSRLLSPDYSERQTAESQLQALQVTEEYGLILAEITLASHESLPLRQMTSVLLKQYVDVHWNTDSEKFSPPEVTPAAKNAIRQILPQGLKESISKVRSSVAYTISAIAHWDWPEEWPELFDILMASLQGSDTFAVQGSIRVLKEFSRDLSDSQIPQVAPVMLPDLYRIFMEVDVYSVRTRSRAIEIFTTLASMICTMAEVNRSLSKSLLSPILPTFTEALVTALHVPSTSHTTDAGLKTEVLKALNVLITNVPKSMAAYQDHIIPPVWQTLTNTALKYVSEVVNLSQNEEEESVDSDGEVMGFENLVFAIFEVVQALLEAPRYRAAVKGGLVDLMYCIVLYMQMTEEQCENWSQNPDQFVEDEDEEGFAFSVRISAQDLFIALCEEFEDECCDAIAATMDRHLSEAETAKQMGNPHWWKIHEATTLALGSVQEIILDQIKGGTVNFNLGNFLQTVVLSNIANPATPFLFGRCLWIGSKFPDQLPDSALPQFLEATIRGLQSDQLMTVRISAVRAVWGFCSHLSRTQEGCVRRTLLNPVLPAVLDALINICTACNNSSEILGLVLENMTVVLSCNKEFTASYEPKITPLVLAIFLKYNSDPVLTSLAQDNFKVLSQNELCLRPVQERLVPTLVSILEADTSKVAGGLQAVALDVLQTLVRGSLPPQSGNKQDLNNSKNCLSDLLLNSAFPAAVHCTLKTDDSSILQSGGECLRSYVSVSPMQITNFRDSDGKSGLWYMVQVAGHLLNPVGSEYSATFVGRLVTTLIKKTGENLGENLEMLLKAVLSKLQGSETLSVIQSLLMVYAQLIHSQLTAVLNFLSSVPGPTGESALSFVLNCWVSRQHIFYGAYENKVTIVALTKLLQHAVETNDQRLQEINVKGDLIVVRGTNGVKTRASTKRSGPDQWTTIPVLAKIFKLIVNEMTDNLNEALASSQEEDDEDDVTNSDEWEDEDEGLGMENTGAAANNSSGGGSSQPTRNKNGVELSKMLDPSFEIYQDDDEEEDPDALSDPIYRLNMKPYLTDFLLQFCKQPYFPHFAQHLTEVEKTSLRSIGVTVE